MCLINRLNSCSTMTLVIEIDKMICSKCSVSQKPKFFYHFMLDIALADPVVLHSWPR